VAVGRVLEHWQRRAQRGQRHRQLSLDLRGVDGDRGRGEVLAEERLGDHAAEGVAHQDRLGGEPADEVRVVFDDVVDAVVGDAFRVGARFGDGVRNTARRSNCVIAGAPSVIPPDSLPGSG
jgi:hypothetical protein